MISRWAILGVALLLPAASGCVRGYGLGLTIELVDDISYVLQVDVTVFEPGTDPVTERYSGQRFFETPGTTNTVFITPSDRNVETLTVRVMVASTLTTVGVERTFMLTERVNEEVLQICATGLCVTPDFCEPERMPINDMLTSPADSPTLAADELDIALAISAAPDGDIVTADRLLSGGDFGPVELQGADVNSTGDERGPSMSADGLGLYFERDGLMFWASRTSKNDLFTFMGQPAGLGQPVPVSGPETSSDELTIYFARASPAGTDSDIFYAERSTFASAFEAATGVGTGVNTTADEFDPSISTDGLTLYFARFDAALGETGIWVATRGSVGDPFAIAVPVGVGQRRGRGRSTPGDQRRRGDPLLHVDPQRRRLR